jgi:hypothetical protein
MKEKEKGGMEGERGKVTEGEEGREVIKRKKGTVCL